MKAIKAIELQFENCEVIRLYPNVLGNIYLGPTSTEIARVATNMLCEFYSVADIALEIFSEANELGEKIQFFDENITVLERIQIYGDITHINILFKDGSSTYYEVDYIEGNNRLARNLNQKSYFSSLGNLYIVISRTKNIEDYFSKEEINDEEHTNFRKEMYDIGVKMNIKRYIKKPIPIRVIQYTGNNREEIIEFTGGKAICKDINGMKKLVIHTLEGDMIAIPGCFITCGPKNEFYPIREDIFYETYDEYSE